MSLPYTLENRPTGSTDPKYKADAKEVMANLEYILSSVAFQKLEVDVSVLSEELNCDTQNSEYGASTALQCNLTHILGESYGGMFLGKLSAGVATGDKVGIMDSAGRCWIATLASDNKISFGEGSGGTTGKCTWERIDGGSAYNSYNDTTWMNGLTIWHLARNTSLSNTILKILKSQIIFSASLNNGVDAADIPLIDTGNYFTTDNIEAALAEFGVHKNSSTDPHGSILTQNNLTVTGTTSLAGVNITGYLTIGTDKVNIQATTGDTAIVGTLNVGGSVVLSSSLQAVSLAISGAGSFGGDLTASTKIITPLIHRDGDFTIEAHSASAQTHIYLKNPDSTYDAVVHLDTILQFDRAVSWGYFSSVKMYPTINHFRVDLNSATIDTIFRVTNTDSTYKAMIMVEKGYCWEPFAGAPTNYNFTFHRISETALELDLYGGTYDSIFYIRNSYSGRKASVDMDGDLNVQGTITGNLSEVVNARGSYIDLNSRLLAILAQSGANFKNCLTVAKSGGQYSTITAALNAITDAGVDNQYIILIYPGKYNESVTLKNYIHLIGLSKEVCTILSGGSYVLTPTSLATCIVANLTIYGEGGATYSFSSTVECNITFENCNFRNVIYLNNNVANLYFKNCQNWDDTGGLKIVNGEADIFHSNFAYIEQTDANGKIEAFNSIFIGNNHYESAVYLAGTSFASRFENCHIDTDATNDYAVNVNSNNHIFLNCILKAPGTGNSFYAASAKTVIASGCVVNIDKHANITITPGTVWQTTNTLNASI